MRAAVYKAYGAPEVVEVREVEKPVPKEEEVLVRVHATTVCTGDWRLRKADPPLIRAMNGLRRPIKHQVLGLELSGVVESVGARVTKFAPGDAVFGSTGFAFGTHAEYVCVAQDGELAHKPVNMSHEEAGAVAFGAISALYFLRKAKLQRGQHLLVYGASGSVGTFAVQLAKAMGAQVTAVCSTRNLELVRGLGADTVLDYTREDFATMGQVFDVVMDTVGQSGVERSLRALKPGGVYALVFATFENTLRAYWASLIGTRKVVGGMASGKASDYLYLKTLIEAGQLRTVIDRRYPLAEIVEAHRYAEQGHKRGNVAIIVHPA